MLVIPNWLSDVLMALGTLSIPFIGWLAWPKNPTRSDKTGEKKRA